MKLKNILILIIIVISLISIVSISYLININSNLKLSKMQLINYLFENDMKNNISLDTNTINFLNENWWYNKMIKITQQQLIDNKKKCRIEKHIKELSKQDIFLLIKLLEKFYYLNNNQILYFNFLINNILKFKLFDFTITTFKKHIN